MEQKDPIRVVPETSGVNVFEVFGVLAVLFLIWSVYALLATESLAALYFIPVVFLAVVITVAYFFSYLVRSNKKKATKFERIIFLVLFPIPVAFIAWLLIYVAPKLVSPYWEKLVNILD